jgi:hypothetical protein
VTVLYWFISECILLLCLRKIIPLFGDSGYISAIIKSVSCSYSLFQGVVPILS